MTTIGDEIGGTNDNAVLLEHVRQLILDAIVNGDRCSINVPVNEVASHHDTEHLRDKKTVARRYSCSSNTTMDRMAKERLLEDKLAHVLLELAEAQINLRLAANAGNALLEELKSAHEEIDTLQDEVEAVQSECNQFKRDTRTLRARNVVLENEVQRYIVSCEGTIPQHLRPILTTCGGNNTLIDSSCITGDHHSPSASPLSVMSCERCGSQEVKMAKLQHRGNEFKRQFIELELTRERDLQRQRELTEEIARLRQRIHEQVAETTHAQQELESVVTQLDEQSHELQRVQAGRDSLLWTTRRLEAENKELRELLTVREDLITQVEAGKARVVSELQVAANRAQAETKRLRETLHLLEEDHENARRRASGMRRELAVKTQEEVEGLEQLLQDALREVTALRQENQILRLDVNRSSEAGSCRRKTVDDGATVADVLASDESTTCSSKRDSKIKLITTLRSGLPRLEIDSLTIADSNASTELLTQSVVKYGNTREIKSLDLRLSQRLASSKDITADADASLILQCPTAISHMNHEDDYCLVDATEAQSSTMRPCGSDRWRTTQQSTGTLAIYESSISELRHEVFKSSPNYLGLSVFACATAATAASLLVRRSYEI